jgi:hypothetical protein
MRLKHRGAPFVMRGGRSFLRAIPLEGFRVGVSGHFDAELIHARSGLVARKLEFQNLITDVGLDFLGSQGVTLLSHIAVGTGSTPPAPENGSLENEVARTNDSAGFSSVGGWGPDNAYLFWRITRVFTQAQANGNLTEVGILRQSPEIMLARQLFRDANGNPTTITKTSEYTLRINYELRYYPPPGDALMVIPVLGIQREVTVRPANVGLATGGIAWTGSSLGTFSPWYGFAANSNPIISGATTLGPRTGIYSGNLRGGVAPGVGGSWDAYVPGSHERTALVSWSPAVANGTPGFNAGYWTAASGTAWQFGWGTQIDKTDAQRFDFHFRFQWARHTP